MPKDAHAEFTLLYKNTPIAILSAEDGKWRFHYTDEFRRIRLRAFVEFPDLDKTYTSDELWPFFAMRIPSLKQPAVRQIVDEESIDPTDEVQLLRCFGRRTVANPFELVESVSDHS